MARYLRDISIHLKHGQKLPSGYSQVDFNLTTHNVRDIFWYLLPPRFEFGEILKLNIDIKGKEEKHDEVRNYGGYVNYSFIDFDFEQYFRSTTREQNETILSVLSSVLKRIPVEKKENLTIAMEAIDSIREMEFDYVFESGKLSKWNQSRSARAIILIRVNEDGQNAYLRVEDKKEAELHMNFLCKNNIYEFQEDLCKSKWIGNTFQILNKQDEVFAEFEFKP